MPYKDKIAAVAYAKTWRKNNKALKKAKDAQYYVAHKNQIRARVKAYAEANKEKVAAAHKVRALRDREAWYAAAKIWLAKHPEKQKQYGARYYAKYPEKAKAAGIAWRRANSAKNCAITARRYAAKLKRTPKWVGPEEKWLIQEAYALAALRTKMLGFSWHVDHVIPLQGKLVSGLHVPLNLRVIPGVDNIKKGNRVEV